MVRLVALLKRRAGMSAEEFYEHWEQRHGPLIAGLPSMRRHVLRYEQHRRAPGLLAGSEGYDGMTVQWFESLDAFHAFVSEPAYAEHIAPDEARFLDQGSIVWLIGDEPTVVFDDTAGADG